MICKGQEFGWGRWKGAGNVGDGGLHEEDVGGDGVDDGGGLAGRAEVVLPEELEDSLDEGLVGPDVSSLESPPPPLTSHSSV